MPAPARCQEGETQLSRRLSALALLLAALALVGACSSAGPGAQEAAGQDAPRRLRTPVSVAPLALAGSILASPDVAFARFDPAIIFSDETTTFTVPLSGGQCDLVFL